MNILIQKGCPPNIGKLCWGPPLEWYLFDVPLSHYPKILIISFIISFSVFSLLTFVQKKLNWKISNSLIWIISSIVLVFSIIIQIITTAAFLRQIIY